MEKENLGFKFIKTKSSEVLITRYGKKVSILRKNKAIEFIDEINKLDFNEQQQLIARLTGNYKRGNEKLAKNHSRNKFN